MTDAEFRKKVIALTGANVYKLELDVALGYFVNAHASKEDHEYNAEHAWDAARAFMAEMRNRYDR